jgi:hypothetical protein
LLRNADVVDGYRLAVDRRRSLETLALEVTSADENRLESSEAKVVVGLRRELLGAQVEEGDDLAGERLGGAEALGEEHDLSDELAVGASHGHASEELLEVVGEVGSTGVARVHCSPKKERVSGEISSETSATAHS